MASNKAVGSAKVRVAHLPKPADSLNILNSLAAHVAVLDPDGTILLTNEVWNRFARENGKPPLQAVGPGANYLDVCARAARAGAPGAQAILAGVKDVLEGRRDSFTVEYPCDSPTEPRWFTLSVTPLAGRNGGAVTSHHDITRQKLADTNEELRRHQQEIKALLDNSPDVIVRLDREARYAYVNAMTARVVGLPPEAFHGKTPGEVGLPGDLCELWARTFRDVFDSGVSRTIEFAYPSTTSDPETVWEERAVPEFAADGSVQSVLMIGRDVTERKKMALAAETQAREIRALAARLLFVEEEERRRIARELHDNLIQQLALLALETGGLVAEVPPPDIARNRLREIQTRVARVTDEVRYIAYKLHPSILDDLGLVMALKALCHEYGTRRPVNVRFLHGRAPLVMPIEVASCLYRIAQESLNNIAKYAWAKHVTVRLLARGQELLLSIKDDGVGFDTAAVRGKGRLGLVSMAERAMLIDAKFSVESTPGHGTRVAVTVALPCDGRSDAGPWRRRSI